MAHVPGKQDRRRILPPRRADTLSCAEKVKAARWLQAKKAPACGAFFLIVVISFYYNNHHINHVFFTNIVNLFLKVKSPFTKAF